MYLSAEKLAELDQLGVKVGKNTLISRHTFIDHHGGVQIGDDSVLTIGVMILSHDAAISVFGGKSIHDKVTIGNKVFIGVNSIILKGITIGDNVIVGAGSVVTRDIPSNQVWAGNPAKFIKTIEEYIQGANGKT